MSTDLQDDIRSFLHRLSTETSWLFSLCTPQQCDSHEEVAELHMWLEYPIQPRLNPDEAQVCTNHSGIWEIIQKSHSCSWRREFLVIGDPAGYRWKNIITWECCFLGLRCHWPVHQTGSICYQPVKSCGQDEDKEGDRFWDFLLSVFSIPICWPVIETVVKARG